MGSGTSSRRRKAEGHGEDTSGQGGSKPSSGPDPSRVVTGLPLRTPKLTPDTQEQPPQEKAMASKDEVFQKASSIFVVLGASASHLACSSIMHFATISK